MVFSADAEPELSPGADEGSDAAIDPISPVSTKRLRWATQRHAGKKGRNKRSSILGRLGHKTSTGSEKKRISTGGDSLGAELGGIQEQPEPSDDGHEEELVVDDLEGQGPRTVYFNLPLPPGEVDDDGNPAKHYRRNKIRTAKYTALSFVPKNLYFQFQNIANVYFLFLIILAVSTHARTHACAVLRANSCLVFQYIRRVKSGLERRTPNCNCLHHGRERRGGGLSTHHSGHRIEQFPGTSTHRLGKCQRERR